MNDKIAQKKSTGKPYVSLILWAVILFVGFIWALDSGMFNRQGYEDLCKETRELDAQTQQEQQKLYDELGCGKNGKDCPELLSVKFNKPTKEKPCPGLLFPR